MRFKRWLNPKRSTEPTSCRTWLRPTRKSQGSASKWREKTSQIDAQIEKNTAAIRDLIAVSRTVIDARHETDKRMARLHSEIKG
jgi:hypothetical protein